MPAFCQHAVLQLTRRKKGLLKVPVRIKPQTMTLMGTIRGLVACSASPPFDVFASISNRRNNKAADARNLEETTNETAALVYS